MNSMLQTCTQTYKHTHTHPNEKHDSDTGLWIQLSLLKKHLLKLLHQKDILNKTIKPDL